MNLFELCFGCCYSRQKPLPLSPEKGWTEEYGSIRGRMEQPPSKEILAVHSKTKDVAGQYLPYEEPSLITPLLGERQHQSAIVGGSDDEIGQLKPMKIQKSNSRATVHGAKTAQSVFTDMYPVDTTPMKLTRQRTVTDSRLIRQPSAAMSTAEVEQSYSPTPETPHLARFDSEFNLMEYRKLKSGQESLIAINHELQNSLDEYRKELSSMKEFYEKQIVDLNKQLREAREQDARLKTENISLKTERTILRRHSHDGISSSFDADPDEIIRKKDEHIHRLQLQINELTEKRKLDEQDVDENEALSKRKKSKAENENEQIIDRLKEKIEELNEINMRLQKKLEREEQQIGKLKITHNKLEQAEAVIEIREKIVGKKEDQISEEFSLLNTGVAESLKKSRQEVADLRREIEEHSKIIADKNKAIQTAEATIDLLKKEKEELNQKLYQAAALGLALAERSTEAGEEIEEPPES